MARHSKRRPQRRRRSHRSSNRPYLVIGLLIIVAAFWAVQSMGGKNKADADANEVAVNLTQGLRQGSVARPQVLPETNSPLPDRSTPPVVTVKEEPASDAVSAVLAQATALLASDPQRLVEVRRQLNDALMTPMSRVQLLTVQDKLAELARQWLFGPTLFEGEDLCEMYAVQPGDNLEAIGKKYGVPYQIIMQINSIPTPQALKAGGRIKVPNGPFHAKVYKSTFTMDLYLKTTYVKSYRIGIGKPGHETPTGLWEVRLGDKMIKPQWTDQATGRVYYGDEPDYPLGDRWIGIKGLEGDAVGRTGFALHGTHEPESIGTACSNGCIRMRNEDVVEVFGLLQEIASRVNVMD